MHSCLYEGIVTHRRCQPVAHEFQYRLGMVYLDLGELPSLVGHRRLIAGTHYASRSFLRSDHLFEQRLPLADEVRQVIRGQTGETPRGPIRLLTQLRCFGYYFSPLNLYYVYRQESERVEYVVAEVNNTPWRERHCYVLWDGNCTSTSPALDFAHPKTFHVSPFLGMDMEYRWRLAEPGVGLSVHLANWERSRKVFSAGLTLERRPLTRAYLRRMTLRDPLMTAHISAAIYFQALKLWWKKCPFHAHPRKPNDSPSRVPTGKSPAR